MGVIEANDSPASSAPACGKEGSVDQVISDITGKLHELKPLNFDPLRAISSHGPSSALWLASSEGNNESGANTASSSSEDENSCTTLAEFLNLTSPSETSITGVSVSEKIEAILTEYFTAITMGAAVGAAVAAGLGVGILAASSLISSGKYVTRLYRWAFGSRRHQRRPPSGETNNNHNIRPYQNTEDNTGEQGQSSGEIRDGHQEETNVSFVGRQSDTDCIVLLRGNVRTTHSSSSLSSIEQCQECLDHVSILLGKQRLGWMNVRRLTAYLVTDRCDARTFRQVLEEYPLARDNAIVSVLYVQKLEDENAVVQVDVMASTI